MRLPSVYCFYIERKVERSDLRERSFFMGCGEGGLVGFGWGPCQKNGHIKNERSLSNKVCWLVLGRCGRKTVDPLGNSNTSS